MTKKYNEVLGLGVYLHTDGHTSYSAMVIANVSDKISIGQSSHSDELSEVVKKIGTALPVAIVLYGHGILDKHVLNLVPGETGVSRKAIPGLDLADYYTSEYLYGNHGWVSLARKEKVELVLSTLKNSGLSVVDVSLGLTSICPLLSIVDLGKTIKLDGVEMIAEDQQLSNISSGNFESSEVSIEEKKWNASYAPGYAAALNYFIDASCQLKNISAIDAHRVDYGYLRMTRNIVKVGLGLILLLALGNAYYFNDVYPQNEKLALQVNTQKPLLEKVTQLKNQKDQLELAIGSLNMSTTNHAYHVDEIGESLQDAEVLLKSIDLYPIISDRKKINSGDFQFDQSRMVIEGESSHSRKFGEWVNRLRSLDWVEAVDISPFQKNVQGKDEFVVVLKII